MESERHADESGADLLAGGGGRSRLRELLPEHRRGFVALAAALLAAACVGGYAGFAWGKSAAGTGDETPPLTAEVGRLHALNLPYPPYRLELKLQNAGSQPVTVTKADLDVPGFDVSLGLGETRRIGPGESATIPYGVSPTCESARPSGAGTVQVHLRDPSGEAITTALNVSASDDSVAVGYAILCSQPPPGLTVGAETVTAERTDDGNLLLRIELSRTGDGGSSSPDARLLRVSVDSPGLALEGLPVQGSPALPATVPLHLRVSDCEAARGAADDPAALRVALTSGDAPRLLYAHADAEFAAAVRDHIDSRCGSGD